MAEEDVTLKVRKYTYLGASVSDKLAVSDSLLGMVKEMKDEDPAVKWLRVERLEKSGDEVMKTIHELPPNVHSQIKISDTECSFQHLIDAGGLMKEVDPKLRISALVTGLGAYIIAFSLDSFAEDVPETSKLDLVREICDSVGVIGGSISYSNKVLEKYYSKPQVILLGTYKGTDDPTEVERRQKVVSDLLKQEFDNETNCNFVCTPESDEKVWAIDVSKDSPLEDMWKALDNKVAAVEVKVPHSWIEAHVSFDNEKKAKYPSKPVSKQDCQKKIKKVLATELTNEEFEKLFDVFHLLGRLVAHNDLVFSQTYLCEIFQCLSKNNGMIDNCLKPIGTMLVDKGLAVNFIDGECVVPSVFPKYNGNPPESAAPFYLAIVKGFTRISPISITIFWRMITAVQAKKPWECDPPNYCNYIYFQYNTVRVHVFLVGRVIKVAVEKRINRYSKTGNNMKKFADMCQAIQKSLLNALEKIVSANKGINVKWGFACEGDHPTKDSSPQCISITIDPNDYGFVCPLNRDHQPHLTLRHEVWFLTEIHEGHQLVKDKGIWTVPESVDQPDNDPPSSNAPIDSDEFNHPPSDAGLQGVVNMIPDSWKGLAISLGVPLENVTAFSKKDLGGLLALQYWRDGKSGKDYRTTWTFLLNKVSENNGSNVADDLKKDAVKNYPSWWKLDSTG